MELLDQKSALTTTKQLLETTYQALLTVKTSYDKLIEQKAELVKKLDTLNSINEQYTDILKQLLSPDITDEERAELNEKLGEIDKSLEPYKLKKEGLAVAIAAANAALKEVDSSIGDVNKRLAQLGTDTSRLDETLNTISGRISQINDGIAQIDSALSGLDDNSVTVNDALATIAQQQASADFKMSGAMSNLVAQQAQLVRDRRLRDARDLLQLGDALLPLRQGAEDLEAREIRQRIEDLRRRVDDVVVLEECRGIAHVCSHQLMSNCSCVHSNYTSAVRGVQP